MVAYTDIGEGFPVVLIHGLGSRKEAWVHQHPLSKKYRLIIPDLRGHGETDINEGITVSNFAKDILELLDSLGIKSAYICGLSLGGIVAQEIYKQSPGLVKGLILANTTSYIHPLFASSVVYNAERNHTKEDYIDEIVNRGLYSKRKIEKAKEAFLIRESYMRATVAPIGLNYFPILPTINVPVLLIGGARDRVTPILNLCLMAMFIRRVQKVIFPNTGHLSNIERSTLFNRCVSDFIGNI